MNWAQQKRYEEYYQGELQRVGQANPDVDTSLLHPFIAAAEGNFDAGVEQYRAFAGEWALKHPDSSAAAVGEALTTPVDPALPPPVLGSDPSTTGGAPVVPPVEQPKQTLDEAINDFMAENRANAAPPVVGSA